MTARSRFARSASRLGPGRSAARLRTIRSRRTLAAKATVPRRCNQGRKSMRYLLKALLVACLIAPIHPMLAQDEGKPVPVEKAAYHWPIFSNDYIMLLRVYMRPGKGSNFHTHSNDQISILVEAGANEGQIYGKTEKIAAKAGTRGSVGFTAFS